MGRHSDGKNNYKLAANAVTFLVGLLVLGLVAVWFFFLRNDGPVQPVEAQCVSGELNVPVAAANTPLAQQLIDDWSDTNPVVRDYCAQPVLVDDVASAAVYLGPNNPVTTKQLEKAERSSATGDPQPVHTVTAGLWGKSTISEPSSIPATDVSYENDPSVNAIVASTLTDTAQDAAKALRTGKGEYVAGIESDNIEGSTFTELPEARLTYAAFPLNAGGSINEDQARAGAAFAKFAAEGFEGEVAQPEIKDAVWTAASEQRGNRPTESSPAPQATAKADTLFLLDTSTSMEPYSQAAAQSIGKAANDLIDSGNQVALWNYSSPLTPGVTKGWRSNVQFTEEKDAVANRVAVLQNDGQSHTREAVEAAADLVAEYDGDYRIVLISGGYDDTAGDDAAFKARMQPLLDKDVEVSVVAVGNQPVDPALEEIATLVVKAPASGDIEKSVLQAAGL
ncbi:VWA domain-containing protein [Corynebacterium breve]|uniref:VWA domain-containing protein n=1 Tax=Corynebacterium breve TaxID=3049799 RepID=A0ABY8VMM2_9CORY|nr:vWA domain-containing protein [Corynebacterium breve]WIM68810.1 VWA domain-containing protein [Corynebacterium breve]